MGTVCPTWPWRYSYGLCSDPSRIGGIALCHVLPGDISPPLRDDLLAYRETDKIRDAGVP